MADGQGSSSGSSSEAIVVDSSMQLQKLSDTAWRYEDTKKRHKFQVQSDIIGDISLKSGSTTLRANRAALQESSTICANLLSSGSNQETLEIPDDRIGTKQLESALEYVHLGSVTLLPESAEDTLAAATALQIDWLKRACCHYLVYATLPANCSRVVDTADRLQLPELRCQLFSFLGLNLLPLHDGGQLLDLPENVLAELLGGAHYVEAPEELVLQVVVEWVNSHFEDRQASLAKLLALVRFNLMNPEELKNLPSALLEVDGVRARVDAAQALWQDAYGVCTSNQAQLEPRGADDLVVALSTHADDTILYVRPTDGRAFHEQFGCSVSGTLLDHAGTAKIGNFLFVVGGYDMGYDVNDRVHRYDPRFRNWMPVASLLQKRVNFAIASSSGNIYVVGGSTRHRPAVDPSASDNGTPEEEEYEAEPGEGETPLKSCEKYDPVTNSWSEMPALPYGCFGLAGCYLHGCLYVTGGITDNPSDSVPVNRTYKLTLGTESQEWTPQAAMLVPRQSHGLISVGTKIYAVGGSTATPGEVGIAVGMHDCSRNEYYDPETNQWTEITATPPTFGRLYRDAVVWGDSIFVLGGKASRRYLHEYNTATGEWKKGGFCGHNLIKLLGLRAAVPLMPADETEIDSDDK